MKLDVCLLLFMNLLSAIGYSIVAPLFPLLGQKDHLSELIIGTLIYAYFFRALHGFGAGTVAIIVYSLVNSISEKEEAQLALGYLELVWSCGVALGPIISSFFYYLGGYSLPFYFVSVLLAVSVYFVRVLKVVDSEDKGKKEGAWRTYSSQTGTLLEEDFYRGDKRNGTCRTFFADGKISTRIDYIDGQMNGVSETYYPGEQIFIRGMYHNGLKIKTWDTYDANGKIRKSQDFNNSRLQRF